jgi:hypothetical protein
VIEVGAGNGLNLPFYPAAVDRVLAVEPEPLLREAATKNAREAPVPVEVVDGVSGRLPADDLSTLASRRVCCAPSPISSAPSRSSVESSVLAASFASTSTLSPTARWARGSSASLTLSYGVGSGEAAT